MTDFEERGFHRHSLNTLCKQGGAPWFSCVTTASKEALMLFLEHRISISASTLMLLAQQSLTIFDTLADVHAQTGILPSLIIEQCEEARRSSPFDALPLASLSHIARKGKNKVYC